MNTRWMQALVAPVLVFFCLAAAAQVPQPPEIAARNYMLVDVSAHQTLAAKDIDSPVHPASLTKLMSTYLVFQALKARKIDLKQTVNRLLSYGGNLPTYWGVYQDNDPKKRLMIIANVDNDIGESWEYSAMGFVPVASSNEMYKLGINYVIYALTH